MTLYTRCAVDSLINTFLDEGGRVCVVEEGMDGLGKVICVGEGFKSAVITERYADSMEIGYNIRLYRKLPKKYEDALY